MYVFIRKDLIPLNRNTPESHEPRGVSCSDTILYFIRIILRMALNSPAVMV